MKTAKQTLIEKSTPVVSELIQLDETRFFIQTGWNVLQVDTHAFPNSRLLRGEITPLRSWQHKEGIEYIIPGALIPGSEEADSRDGRVRYGRYWRHAQQEAERILALETASEYKSGLTEIVCLRPIPQLYDQVDLSQLIWNRPLSELPASNKDLLALLAANQQSMSNNSIAPALIPIFNALFNEIAEIITKTDQIQVQRLQLTHNQLKMNPNDPGAKRAYDEVDREMLVRTGLPEMYSTETSIARTLDLMQQRDSLAAPTDLTQAIASLAETQQAILQFLTNQAKTVETRAK